MNLIIFPGAGDPNTGKYKQVMDLMEKEAIKRGFKKIEICIYPGQNSFATKSELNFGTSTNEAIQKIKKFENLKEEYYILGKSYGCYVSLNAINSIDNLNYLKKITLWGPSPINTIYDLFKSNYEETAHRSLVDRGCVIPVNFYDSLVPIEFLIYSYNKEIPLKLGLGELDEYTNWDTIMYFSKLSTNKQIELINVRGVEHSVTEANEHYFHAIFY